MPVDVDSFIDEDFLNRLEKLKIITKKGVKGPEKGDHSAKQTGEGLEFLDYRKYHPGDDLRYVDWSVYGRLDKLFIKLFHAEENQTVHILLDMSRSMGFGSPPKHISAKKIAAAVSYIALSSLDKTGMMSFADEVLEHRPPVRGRRKYPDLLNFLLSLKPAGGTDLDRCLTQYASICKNPGIAIIISDLFDEKGYQDGLLALTHRNFDIHLVQVLDHEELFWTKTGNLLLTEIETGQRKATFLDKSLLESYRQTVERFLSDIQHYCSRYGINYYLHDTRIPFEDFLIDYLTKETIFR